MVFQLARKKLSGGNYGGVPCLHFDPSNGNKRCDRSAGAGVFCTLGSHAANWGTLSEEQQNTFNAMLTNPEVAYNSARWAEVFVTYRDGKTSVQQYALVGAMAEFYATGVEQIAAAKVKSDEHVARARQRVQGV
jgi:hypothetical protein